MNPLVYYRISKPTKNTESLPMIDIKSLFKQEQSYGEFIIRKSDPTAE
jgi:hypothetical protein